MNCDSSSDSILDAASNARRVVSGVSVASGTIRLMALCVLFMLIPGAKTGRAQCTDPNSTRVTGHLLAVDGSTPAGPPTPGWANIIATIPGCCCGGFCQAEGYGYGSVTVGNAHPHWDGGTADWIFSGSMPGYCTRSNVGGATCWTENGCGKCSGSFDIGLYADSGNFIGKVTKVPSKKPAVGVTVALANYPYTYTTTDAAGQYNFASGDPIRKANNWGVPVTCAVDGAGPGRAKHTLTAGGISQEAWTKSSHPEPVNFELREPEATEPDVRSPQCDVDRCPPCSVGNPVHITSGNVFFDQTDASLPGRGGTLSWTRSYNSLLAWNYVGGAFGRGWSHSYESAISRYPASASVILLRQGDGSPLYFEDNDGDMTYQPSLPITERSYVVQSSAGYTRKFRAGGQEGYDTAGRLVSITDKVGRVTTLERDGFGKLLSVREPGGRTLRLSYDDAGRIVALAGPAGAVARYEYGSNGFLAAVTYADERGVRFTYDDNALVLRVTDLTGQVIESHEYDGSGRGLTSEITDGREKFTVTYGDGLTTVVDALNNTTKYYWESFWGKKHVTKREGPCASCGGAGEVEQWEYDTQGRIVRHEDGLGNVTTYAYDDAGNLLTKTDALGRTTAYIYDSEGRVRTETAPNGAVTTHTYVPAGPKTLTDAHGRTTTFDYYPSGHPNEGQLQSTTDPRGKVTAMTYEATGDLKTVTDPMLHATTFEYDVTGRRIKVNDARLKETTTAYDAQGRVTRITNPDGTHTGFTYDLHGQRASVADALGKTTRYVYNAYGWLEKVIDPANGVTTYGYDLMGQLTSLTDAKGQTTRFEYTGGRMTKTIHPGTGSVEELFEYDPAGRLWKKTDRKGVVTTYTYDALNRLTGKAYSDGTTPAVTYTYDENGSIGELTSVSNGTDTLRWRYNLGEMLSEQSTKNGSTVAYTYDLGGNRFSVSLDGTLHLTYAYDDDLKLQSLTRGSSVFGFGYDVAHKRTTMTYPNDVTTTYGYNDLTSLLESITAQHGTMPVASVAYANDAVGNRTRKQLPGLVEDYAYDPLYRLTGVARTGTEAKDWLFGYDAVGNRITEQVNGAATSAQHDEKNRLLSRQAGGMTGWRGQLDEPGNVTFTSATVNGKPASMLSGNVFEADLNMQPGSNTVTLKATDASGNLTTKTYNVNVSNAGAVYTHDANGNHETKTDGADTWRYTWNAENQLTRVTRDGAEVATFKYDPLGRRVEKVAGGVTTTWTYDGGGLLRETRSDGTTYIYVHGPGIDEPLARIDQANNVTYHHADGLGSIVKMTDSAGNVIQTRQYDAWGNLEVGADQPVYAFTAREWDPETNLYYYRARYYDPKAGRFISEDPMGLAVESNFYVYAHNNPILFVDPTGTKPPAPGMPVSTLPPSQRMHMRGDPTGCPDGDNPVSYQEAPPLKSPPVRDASGRLTTSAAQEKELDAWEKVFTQQCEQSAYNPRIRYSHCRKETYSGSYYCICCEICVRKRR